MPYERNETVEGSISSFCPVVLCLLLAIRQLNRAEMQYLLPVSPAKSLYVPLKQRENHLGKIYATFLGTSLNVEFSF